MKPYLPFAICCLLLSAATFAQFTGPSATDRVSTVEQAQNAPINTYVTVTGNIVVHLGQDYYSFRDATGDIRVEIERSVWRSRDIGPDTKVRLLAEVDRNISGTTYLWVESLDIVE